MRWRFLNNALFGIDVLLLAEGGESSGLFVSIVDHSLLGIDFHLYLGGSTPFVIYGFTRLGAEFGCGIFGDVDRSELGWYDQWVVDLAGCLGSSEGGCGVEVYGGGDYGVWYGHI